MFDLADPWKEPVEIWRNGGNSLSYAAMLNQVLVLEPTCTIAGLLIAGSLLTLGRYCKHKRRAEETRHTAEARLDSLLLLILNKIRKSCITILEYCTFL